MILKLSTCNRRSLLCTCACRAWSLNVFQFVVALLKNFPTSSNSLKNAMPHKVALINCGENKTVALTSWDYKVSAFLESAVTRIAYRSQNLNTFSTKNYITHFPQW